MKGMEPDMSEPVFNHCQPVKPNGRVCFQCTRCTDCCRHVRDAVMLEPLDAYRIARYLGLEISEVCDRYTDPIIFENTGFPFLAIKTKGEDEACVFLNGKDCAIQKAKPRVCRMYPFTANVNSSGQGFDYCFCTEQQHHHGNGPSIQVKDWLQDTFDKEQQAFLLEDYSTLLKIIPLMREIQKDVSKEKHMETILLLCRYMLFETSIPFLPQQQRNNRMLIRQLTELAAA